MINRFVGVGRLVADPQLKYTPSGVAMTRFKIAINRQFTNQQGEKETDFISCIAFRKQAENLANFIRKGSLIGLEGRIQTGSYEGQDGKRVYTTDVVADSIQFLEPRNSTGSSQGTTDYQSSGNTGGTYQGAPQGNYGGNNNQPSYTRVDEDPFADSKGPIEVNSDDLPF